MSVKKTVFKSAFSMGTLTIASKIFGYIRDRVLAELLGTSHSTDAFYQAFRLPNLLRRFFAEGAFTAGFVPVFYDLKRDDDLNETNLFISRLFILQALVLLLVVILGIWFAPQIVSFVFSGFSKVPGKVELTVRLTRIMFSYIFFISLAAVCQGTLNSYRIFSVSAATPILLNITIISSAFFLKDHFSDNAYPFAFGVIAGGVLQFLFQLPFMRKVGFRFVFTLKLLEKNVVRSLKLMVPVLIGGGIYQINILISQAIASMLPEGHVSSLDFSNRIIEIILGVFAVSLSTVVLPVMSESVKEKRDHEIKDILEFSIKLILLVSIPATAGLVILRSEIISLLFLGGAFDSRSVELTSFALLFHAFGILFIASYRVLVQYFYSNKDTKTPLKVAAATLVINATLCYVLSSFLENGGIALATSLSASFSSLVLFVIIAGRIKFDYRTLSVFMTKIIGAALFMSCVLFFIKPVYSGRLWTGILIISGAVVFMAISSVLMRGELKTVLQSAIRRKSK